MVIWGMVYYCFIHIQYMTSHNSGQTSSTTVFSSCAGAPLTVSPKRLQFRCPKLENTAWEGAQATYVDYMRGNIHKKKLPCWTHCRHSGLPLTTSFIVPYYSRERTISSPRTNKFHWLDYQKRPYFSNPPINQHRYGIWCWKKIEDSGHMGRSSSHTLAVPHTWLWGPRAFASWHWGPRSPCRAVGCCQ